MLETRDDAYMRLLESNNLCYSQSLIFNFIVENPKLSRQIISERLGLTINSVCGRIKELIDMGLIVEDGQMNGQGLLRIRNEKDKIIVPKMLTALKFENLLKHIRDSMEIANDYQRKQVINLVQQWK
jgi:predicted transcriptional regulator